MTYTHYITELELTNFFTDRAWERYEVESSDELTYGVDEFIDQIDDLGYWKAEWYA